MEKAMEFSGYFDEAEGEQLRKKIEEKREDRKEIPSGLFVKTFIKMIGGLGLKFFAEGIRKWTYQIPYLQ
ncbi:MAG: hypothetical protein Q4C06_08425 [Bacillota bacterium]|nr:hypothetical protein [Bacillota bacterium]